LLIAKVDVCVAKNKKREGVIPLFILP